MNKVYAFVFLMLSITGSNAFSQSGTLDVSFGNGGKVVTVTGISSSVANSIAITTNGKIVAGGYEYSSVNGQSVGNVLQYNSDGTLDTTFGTEGKVLSAFADQSAIASVAIQPDGKIIAGGYAFLNPSKNGFLIARYNTNGSLDSTFGTNGIVITSFPAADGKIVKVLIKANGKILTGGTVYAPDFSSYPAFAQYLPDGTPDSTFGINGAIEKKGFSFLGGETGGINDMSLTAAGKIIAAINEIPMGTFDQTDFLIYQLLPNGNNDSTFGINGAVQTDLNNVSGDNAYSVVALPDNSFVVTGYSDVLSVTRIALAKYKINGSLDSSFGMSGKVYTQITNPSSAYHILSSPDGNLFVCGYASYPSNFAVVKYFADGALDSSFDGNGITTTGFYGDGDVSYFSALQPDGKIVLVGQAGDSTKFDIALARYNNAIVYPLHLLSFTAIKNGSANLLQWQTAQEINTDGFAIQRSDNGREYYNIGYVNAGNNPYHFTDEKPVAESNYYRLETVDKNGSFTYSSVREITNNNTFTVSIYPNPVNDKINVQVSCSKNVALQTRIVAMDGKVILSDHWTVQAGSFTKDISVTSLPRGSYYLVVTTKANERAVIPFEKL